MIMKLTPVLTVRAYQSLLKSIINKAYAHDLRSNRKKCNVFQRKCADAQSDMSLLSAYIYILETNVQTNATQLCCIRTC